MLYLIDSGNAQEIEEALMLGARGVTANTSMYRKNDIRLHDFVNGYSNRELDFLSGSRQRSFLPYTVRLLLKSIFQRMVCILQTRCINVELKRQ